MAKRVHVSERDREILRLWRGGGQFDEIAELLEVRNAEVALAGALRALEAEPVPDLMARWRIENIRLDRLTAGLWDAAASGDQGAVDRIVKISEVRSRLKEPAPPDGVNLVDAFDRTVEACGVDDRDAALIAGGRKIAHRIDQASATSSGEEVTKALYLLPHLNKVLEAMLATPAARAAVSASAERVKSQGVDELAKQRQKVRSRKTG